MRIILSPVASNKTTTVSVNGITITVDGTDYDLSVIPENGQADADENSPFVGTVTREQVTIRYEYDSHLADPNQSADLADYTFDVTGGEVPCPIKWRVAE